MLHAWPRPPQPHSAATIRPAACTERQSDGAAANDRAECRPCHRAGTLPDRSHASRCPTSATRRAGMQSRYEGGQFTGRSMCSHQGQLKMDANAMHVAPVAYLVSCDPVRQRSHSFNGPGASLGHDSRWNSFTFKTLALGALNSASFLEKEQICCFSGL